MYDSIIACVTGQYDCDRIIDAAKAIADEAQLTLHVLSVLKPASDYTLISGQLEYLYTVSKNAGADMTVIFDSDAAKAAAEFAFDKDAVGIVTGMHDGGKNSFLVRFNRLLPEASISMVDKNNNIYSMNVRAAVR